jgi:hypothetical protein
VTLDHNAVYRDQMFPIFSIGYAFVMVDRYLVRVKKTLTKRSNKCACA